MTASLKADMFEQTRWGGGLHSKAEMLTDSHESSSFLWAVSVVGFQDFDPVEIIPLKHFRCQIIIGPERVL